MFGTTLDLAMIEKIPIENIDKLSMAELDELIQLTSSLLQDQKERKITTYYPATGALSREKYPKHMAFFAAGSHNRERLMMAANRVGKTEGVGGYEVALHLTGLYPEWWPGRRFKEPVRVWVAGDTAKTVRDIIQLKLLGKPGEFGTGLLPRKALIETRHKQGVADAVDTVTVRHVSGGTSRLVFLSYDQGRTAFQGTEQEVVWLDEEPPMAIYTECLIRTMTTDGMVICTFTPLQGISDVVKYYLPGGKVDQPSGQSDATRFVIMADWDDAPHLSEKDKQELLAAIPPHQRDARSKGIPALGSGAIYPIPESDFLVPPFEVPAWWPRVYGLDVGWNRTAAVWAAWDRETNTVYLIDEYYRGQAEPSVHKDAIHARGSWIPGVIDPASHGRGQKDGESLLQTYRNLGLHLEPANNAVEAGIQNVWERLSCGQMRVFNTLRHWLDEYRLYHRDEQGRIVKRNDHLMDALRYLVLSGLDLARTKIRKKRRIVADGAADTVAGY
ncbi:MAG: terminase family protein [Magnetococcus sp. DMHC-1]